MPFFTRLFEMDWEAVTHLFADFHDTRSWVFYFYFYCFFFKSGYYPLISAEKMPWFRCVVMVRNPRCVSGNTLLVSVSQGKEYLSRIYQDWPWKKVHTKEKLRQVTFNVFCVRLICLISLIIGGLMELLQLFNTYEDRSLLLPWQYSWFSLVFLLIIRCDNE